MSEVFRFAAGVANAWSLAAFAIAAVLYLLLQRRGKVPAWAWVVIVLLAVLPATLGAYRELALKKVETESVYQVRVTVTDPRAIPLENAQVWSSAGGEPKRVAGGWQFDIPAASKPAGGRLTVFAAVPEAFLSGKQELQLLEDRHPALTIQLEKAPPVSIRGNVVDERGRALKGARVGVVGYEDEAVLTPPGGNFVLPAHKASGQQVRLHAEKKGYGAVERSFVAGDEPVTIRLVR